MTRTLHILAIAALAALALAAAGCSTGGSLTTIEGPVPEGMPVVYEFFTEW